MSRELVLVSLATPCDLPGCAASAESLGVVAHCSRRQRKE